MSSEYNDATEVVEDEVLEKENSKTTTCSPFFKTENENNSIITPSSPVLKIDNENSKTAPSSPILKMDTENSKTTPSSSVLNTDCNSGTDEYAYLNRSDFTSEKFKIEIRGLPKFYGMNELKKLLNDKLRLASNKIKSPRRGSKWIYVCFRCEEDRVNAISAITGYVWKGKTLTAELAKPAPDPLVKKRKQDFESACNSDKKLKNELSQDERLMTATVPLWNVPYEEQLKLKQDDVRKVLLKLGNELWKGNPSLRGWIEKQRTVNAGLPCELLNIRSCEKRDGYRTKCEFTVGMNEETNLPTVGFRLGSYVKGFTGVAPVDNLVHIPQRMKIAVKLYEEFVRSYSLEVFSPEFQSGHFRQLTARWATDSNELMLIVGVQIKDLEEEQVSNLKRDLTLFFTEGSGKEGNITSLYFVAIHKKISEQDVPKPEHLLGSTHITETVLGLKFRISPVAFFQVNTQGAEILYSSAIELVEPTENTSLVDICCGTGTIGLCFAKHCGQVLGLELIPEAIEDAKANASLNGITNADFFYGKAEELLSAVLRKTTKEDVVAVVDPPRAGLHQKALVQLRQSKNLNKILYISCNPAAAVKNFIDLGRSQTKLMYREPFVPIKAVAVDMFPHTKHCELIIYFERLTNSQKERKLEGAISVKDT